MNGGRYTGLFFIVVGGVAFLPVTGTMFKWLRDLQFKMVPWIKRFPGVETFYTDRIDRALRFLVGTVFIVAGTLALTGVVEF